MSDPRSIRLRSRPLAVLLAMSTIVVTLGVATAVRPVRLTEVLLIVLVEVIGVSLVAGRTVAALTAVAAVAAVNWLLVAPYGTLRIAEEQNWVTLAVFLVLAVGASSLVESVLASERRTAAAQARESALAEALNPDEASAVDALAVLCSALHLDVACLEAPGGGERLLSGVAVAPPGPATLHVDVAPGFRVLGWGDPVLGAHPDYVNSLATAAVRAWESERLVAEQARSAQLAEIDQARAALLASIGHDLRTPLTSIRVSADAIALAGDTLPAAERADLLDSLRESALRLDRLLDAILDAARLETGVATSAPRPCDLRPVVDAAVADLANERLHVDLPSRAVPATVDPVLCERVVANLVANALAHTPPGTPVEVSVTEGPDGPAIAVVDHGPGLSDQVDTGRHRAGLGLVIVERLSRAAGISVRQWQTPGGGLTVELRPEDSAWTC